MMQPRRIGISSTTEFALFLESLTHLWRRMYLFLVITSSSLTKSAFYFIFLTPNYLEIFELCVTISCDDKLYPKALVDMTHAKKKKHRLNKQLNWL